MSPRHIPIVLEIALDGLGYPNSWVGAMHGVVVALYMWAIKAFNAVHSLVYAGRCTALVVRKCSIVCA